MDYNGEGDWSAEEIQRRYRRYAEEVGIAPRDISPREHVVGTRRWVYPVMREVIMGIDAGDAACIRIGIEFIEQDQGFSFGRILKSNTARALRRAPLSPEQRERIVRRVIAMMQAGNTPWFREFAKLARSVGLRGSDLPPINTEKPWVARWVAYFHAAARPDQRSK